jgi:DNA polymerase-4
LVTTLCRDCVALTIAAARSERCGECGSPRQVCHATLDTLSIAHVDCDAFYATAEKRDRPDLADRPVIIGGGSRGVVLACCYVARLYGVRSAIPMFKALAACPDAVVIRPDMAKYRDVGRRSSSRYRSTRPFSTSAAPKSSTGHARPAPRRTRPSRRSRARDHRVDRLSDNKFLAKLASDLDKPRGFAVLGRSEAAAFLADKPVALLWGWVRRCSGASPATASR